MERTTKKNILITGGLGFIGSNLAQECVRKGHEVTLLSKSRNKIENIGDLDGKVSLNIKDIRDISEKDVAERDYIFHCASTSDNYNIHSDPYLDIEVNCNGTMALLEACRKWNPQTRIVYPSTFFVNGNLSDLPATPESPTNPLGLYPATRLAGEHFCKIYNQVFDMDTAIARFTNVFGAREQRGNKKKAAFNWIIQLAMENKEIPLYLNGEFSRDYIYVSDVVNACLTIAEKGKSGEVYYVGKGPVRFRDLVELVIEEAGGGTIKSIEPPEFHKNVGIKDYYCDTKPLRDLGWQPERSLRQGIQETIKWYSERQDE